VVAAQSSASPAFLIDANRLAERVEVDGRNGFRMALAYLQLKHLALPTCDSMTAVGRAGAAS
jgi:hypothetical protein